MLKLELLGGVRLVVRLLTGDCLCFGFARFFRTPLSLPLGDNGGLGIETELSAFISLYFTRLWVKPENPAEVISERLFWRSR